MALNQIEYSEEIKNLINNLYEPVLSIEDGDECEKKTLSDIYQEVVRVLPSKWIEESDVYEALQELGFKVFTYTIEAPKSKNEDDEEFILNDNGTYLAYFLSRK